MSEYVAIRVNTCECMRSRPKCKDMCGPDMCGPDMYGPELEDGIGRCGNVCVCNPTQLNPA